jgi:predicted nucleotidyltransferase
MVSLNQASVRKEIVDKLSSFDPEKIILFGSWAYGTPHDSSDLDICVVKECGEKRYAEAEEMRRSLKFIPVEKDIIIESPEFLASHSGNEWINTSWYDITHDGVVLYEKK